jgi:hypothetical protein
MTVVRANITTELLAHADGRPIAYIDASVIAVFAYQERDGTYIMEICTRDDIPSERLHLFLDGNSLPYSATIKLSGYAT